MVQLLYKLSIKMTNRVAIRDVPVNNPVLGICRVSHYPVLTGPGKVIDPSIFIFFKSTILNRIV